MLTEWIDTAVAIGATNENIFANSRYATLSRPAMVTYYAVQDGAAAGLAALEITHGNTIIRTLSPVPTVAAGTGPLTNEHLVARAVADINDRIVIKAVNNGAAIANFRVLVEISFA